MQRIAVFNTAFLGDAVLTLPLLQSLRLRYPEAVVDFYVRKGLEPLFAPHPALDAVYGFDKRGRQKGLLGLCKFGAEVARRSYDIWLSAHSSPRSGLVALASRSPLRIGYKTTQANFFYNRLVDRRFGEMDEIERLLRLLEPLGQGPVYDWPELALTPEARDAADVFFAPLDGPVLGMHPGSVWATKRWPAEYFAEIGVRAIANGSRVVLFAGAGEEQIARTVRDCILEQVPGTNRFHDFSGLLSLAQLAAWLGRIDCYLTNDSGPMHLAWVQGTPVTAIFGPTVREHGFMPRGAGATVFEVPEPCRPCGLHGHASCPLGHHRCMTTIRPDQVWLDVAKKLWP